MQAYLIKYILVIDNQILFPLYEFVIFSLLIYQDDQFSVTFLNPDIRLK